MKTIAPTKVARLLRRIRNHIIGQVEAIVARPIAGPGRQNALEAMADLYRTLPDDVAATWASDARVTRWKGNKVAKGMRDPWTS